MRLGLAFILIWLTHLGLAQHPIANFNAPSTGCINQSIKFENLSSGASYYEWDFCQGDLGLTPTAKNSIKLNGNITLGLDIVFDGTEWYGFVASRDGNSIIRLSYGSDVRSVPIVTDLGNIGGLLNKPSDVEVAFENGNWYGFVYSSEDPVITRIDFGNALKNIPSSSVPIVTGLGSSNGGFDLIYEGSSWVMVIIQSSSFKIVKLANITDVPTNTDIIDGISNPYGISLGDVVIQKYNGNYYGYVVGFGNQTLQRMEFGSSTFSYPTFTDLTGSLPTGARPYGIDIGSDAGNYFLFVATLEGNLFRVALGTDLTAVPDGHNDLGALQGVLSNTLKIKLVKQNSSWAAFSTDFNTTQLFRIEFPEPVNCSATIPSTSSAEPAMQFTSSGIFYMTLRSYTNGNFDDISKSITISSNRAPDADFQFTNNCVNHQINFLAANSTGEINQFLWDFGDTQTAVNVSPAASHTYLTSGSYIISLEVASNNGCNNNVEKSISIYDPPAPSFTTPSGLLCTNTELVFTNNTLDNFGGLLAYQWYVDEIPVGSNRDLHYTFTTTPPKTIKLVTGIPGCSSEFSHSISALESGPTVDYFFFGHCQSQIVQFTSNISESVNSRVWDFADGSTSDAVNPQHVFSQPGFYNVTLSAISPNGCNNSSSKSILIYSNPFPNFQINPPPLSCTGSPTPFTNVTPNPLDSNIASWQWNFGDTGANTAITQNPSHVFSAAGSYNVSLSATTDQGCSASVVKPVSISSSPTINISNSAACVGLPVNLSATGTGIQSYYWEIGTSYYSISNPSHTFSLPGNYSAKLTVTNSANCQSVVTKPVNVPVPLVPDFSVTKNCLGTDALFTDITAGNDPVAQATWDFAGLGNANGEAVSFRFNSLGTKVIKLSLTAQSGCKYTRAKNITVTAPPKASFDASPQHGAAPLNVQFTNTSQNASLYTWSFADGSAESTTTSPGHIFQDIGNYSVSLKATNTEGCQDVTTRDIQAEVPVPDVEIKVINVSDNPDGSLKVILTLQNKGNTMITDLPVAIDLAGAIMLRETVAGPIAPSVLYNLVLDFGIAKSNNLSFLCATAELENDQSTLGNRICTEFGVESIVFNSYPNPVKGDLHIEWIAVKDQSMHITIVDSFGRSVLNTTMVSTDGLNQKIFDTSNLRNGIYMVVFESGSLKKTQRIFVAGQN